MNKLTTNPLKALRLFMAGMILLTMASCDKDDSVQQPAATRIKEFKNGDEFIRFAYNADGSLQKATVRSELVTGNSTADYVITYNAQKKIAEVNTTLGEKIIPVYENNRMVRADYFTDGERTSYTAYHYEGEQLKIATLYINQGIDYMPFFEFRFTYNAAGNVTETISMITSEPNQLDRAGHIESEYDQKVNPLYEHRDFMALLWQSVSKNNPVREEHFDAQLQPEDLYTYAYTYNAKGLPAKAIVTVGLPGQVTRTETLDFLYQ